MAATSPFVFLPPNHRPPHPPAPNRLPFSSSPKRSRAVELFVAGWHRGSGGYSSGFMCCATPFIGRVGLHRRFGNVSLLSFGLNADMISEDSDSDSSQFLSALLPVVVAATAVSALARPSTFTWVSKELYAPALGGIMLSIGIRLSIDDFALAFKRPLPLSIGFLAQYVLRPVLGVMVAQAFGVPQMFYAGFILTACVAFAQLSSYASFLSKGDVALSVLLTSSSTLASVIITPLLTGLLIGSVVPVDAVAMSKSILQLFLFSSLGLLLNTCAKSFVNLIQPVMPFVAMVCTSLCIGSPLAINRVRIMSLEGLKLVAPVLTFHALVHFRDNLIMHGNAKLYTCWVTRDPVSRKQPSSCTRMLGIWTDRLISLPLPNDKGFTGSSPGLWI